MVKKDSNRAATQLVQAIGISAMTDTNDTIRNARSDAYKELAALAAAPNGYDKHERETLLRERVMDSVIRIRESLDRMTPALSARASAGEGGEAEWITSLRNEAMQAAMKDVFWLSRDQVFELIGGPLTAAPQPAQAGASGGLVKSWRERANRMLPTSGVDTHWHQGARDGMNQCAAELERALLTTPASPATGAAATWEEEIRRHDATPPARGDGEGVKIDYITAFNFAKDNGLDYNRLCAAVREMVTTRPTPEAQEARDAARYRWLRDDPPVTLCVRVRHDARRDLSYQYLDGPQLDAAIDAALALPAQGEGNNG